MAYHSVIDHNVIEHINDHHDIRFQRIENNIKELKESIKFLADVVYDEINSKKAEKNEKKTESRIIKWLKNPNFVYGATIVIGTLASYGLYERFFSDKK